ncbi:MAG: Fe-S cluster assembly protein SufD [Rikenellaceae bacterium]|nr:Fe-S cluster assembly protein SufD [Rikenellaceae bacterium]
MAGTLENRLAEMYAAESGRITEGWPATVNSARREALETLALSGIPGRADEEYRHFDLRAMLDRVVALAHPVSTQEAGSGLIEIPDACTVILDNGICRNRELIVTPGGAVYGSLRTAANERPETVGEYLGSPEKTAAVSILCSAFARDGAFVYVPDGYQASTPFHIDIRYSATALGEACFPRVLVMVGEGARAEIVVTHTDNGRCGIVAGQLLEGVVGDGAILDMTIATSMRQDSVLVTDNLSVQGANSRTATTAVWLRGGATRVNHVTGLDGSDAETSLYGLYLGAGDELCDVNMKVMHTVPDCRSFEVVKGVVSGSATGAFTGMVYVAPDAQRTSALQQSRNLQLSDTSRIFTEPQLEIYADDVKCSHGATVGQLNEEEIYYMRQRGIGEKEARKLQLEGFVNDVISHCTTPVACESITRLAGERIAEL